MNGRRIIFAMMNSKALSTMKKIVSIIFLVARGFDTISADYKNTLHFYWLNNHYWYCSLLTGRLAVW
jgi:hypothetical protein